MITFREFINPGAFANTGFTGFDNQFFGIGHSNELPMPTLNLPTEVISGKISRFVSPYNKDPITLEIEFIDPKTGETKRKTWMMHKKQWENSKLAGDIKKNSRVQMEILKDGTIKGLRVI
jgi:hypothetical protein